MYISGILIILFSILISLFVLYFAKYLNRNPTKNHKLLCLFLSYVLIAIGFSFIYQNLFNEYTRSFVISSDLDLKRADMENEVTQLNTQINLLKSHEVFIEKRKSELIDLQRYHDGFMKLFQTTIDGRPIDNLAPHDGNWGMLIEMIKRKPSLEWELGQHLDKEKEDLNKKINNAIKKKKDHEIEINKLEKIISTHFWDFFYFSTVNMTTVGFGDILPNTSKARKYVMAQIWLSIFLIIVAVNTATNEPPL